MSALKSSHMDYNSIEILNLAWFENLQYLEFLNLAFNKISNLPKNIFDVLINLSEIWLAGNKLKIIHSDSFGNNLELAKIDLRANMIRAVDEKLIDYTGVNKIDMKGNVCSQEEINGRNELMEKLQRCFKNYRPRLEKCKKCFHSSLLENSISKWYSIELALKLSKLIYSLFKMIYDTS